MKNARITIGVPTYNRAGPIGALLDQIQASTAVDDECRVLVIDDASSDGTFSLFSQARWMRMGRRLKYVRNPVNLGYASNFLRLFAECETEYLLVMADDDLLVEDGWRPLLDFVRTNVPTLVSPQWLQHGAVYRGTSQTRLVAAAEFIAASAHAPGILYRVERCKSHLPALEARLRTGCAFANTYPQAVLCMRLLLNNEPCWFLASPIAREGQALPTGIRDGAGESYESYGSRLRQAMAVDQLIAEEAPPPLRDEVAAAARRFYLHRIFAAVPSVARQAFLRQEVVAASRTRVVESMPPSIKRRLKAVKNVLRHFRI